MLNRIKQVFAALTAKISAADRAFVDKYLTDSEQRLFWQMNLPDQRHALNVAYTAVGFLEIGKVNKLLLIRCCLLHDVGKIRGDVSTFDKIITVLAHKLTPKWAAKWGRLGRGGKLDNLRHAFYVYFHHAERSAQMLLAGGTSGLLIDIIRSHHQPPAEGDLAELVLLRRADNKN
ncbi:MAG: HD domain-containing protein [Pelosinus sp.]|nr:HD domain-containing protein [Pelosinus sp.]